MKSLKVVFFGTPEFAKVILQHIHESHHEVVGVVTVADKASGRGQKIQQSAVKQYADSQNLKTLQPEKLRDEHFLEEVRSLQADIFVVVAFRMMPKVLFEMPPLGTFNLHASLLPDYRGAAPINYAIINGEKETGVTTFFINEKIDEGNILLQKKTAIGQHETAGELHDKLMLNGAELVLETLNGLAAGTIEEKPQPKTEQPKTAYKIFKDDTRINWNQPADQVHNFIRGMSPYPAAFTYVTLSDEKKFLKIYSGTFEVVHHDKQPGSFDISKNSFIFYTADGTYTPTEVQLEGKKRVAVKDFLNGFQNFENIRTAE
ncbi:methionyl-tRNA formyltransferase [Chryseobacterium salipaludis]|uniref:methionyl-tRNA formyltransferase n=1 Tax=Chryseobacterium TaxID=59732 RepID=UPI001FF0EDB1|nr:MULTISPECIES: methionyl-tRNA formyltransferase [Chryseobacterium]MCJ8498401.1 methionyl-tRNA formyltransferase [Chryseobacterium salipaludis]MCX3297274.1 methionyl-tRNA formyltransferase [Planobacterium sp. JC490]